MDDRTRAIIQTYQVQNQQLQKQLLEEIINDLKEKDQ
jgi:hypothetical protein